MQAPAQGNLSATDVAASALPINRSWSSREGLSRISLQGLGTGWEGKGSKLIMPV